MSFDQNDYPSAANLIGNVDVPRLTLPLIRSSLRRLDPDGGSSTPYYASASGKTLRVEYTNEVSTVVTVQTVNIAISGNSMATIIANINAAASADIDAIDMDGFLAIRNLNPGKTHYIKILPYTTPASDAAPLLGFAVDPFPGSISFAGEIEAAPGNRIQQNPKTTALLAKDNGLTSREINRPLAAILQMIEDLRADLSRDVITYKVVTITFSSGVGNINDSSLRVYCPPVNTPDTTDLEPYFQVLTTNRYLAVSSSTNYPSVKVNAINYGSPTSTSLVFTAWGTPDGRLATGTTVPNKDKQAATAITSITGNIVYCAGATFVTKQVKAGDPVQLTATTLQPFDHSGWWAVDAVIDETHLALRPMSTSSAESTPAAGNKPRVLNPSAGGTLRVAVGRFLPAGSLYLGITDSSVTSMRVRIPVATPLRDALAENNHTGGIFLDQLASRLYTLVTDHINDTSAAHAAASIDGFTSATSWADASTITGANLKATIEDILTDLATTTGNGGAARVGSPAVSIGGSAPNSLSSGSVRSQIVDLLTALQAHVVDTTDAHAASAISYAGGSAWADTTTNPATTVELQLDKIVSDLSPSTGTAKIGGAAVGSDLSAGTLAAQITSLVNNWGKLSRINTWSAAQTFSALITASLGITVGNDQNILLQGTGYIKHGIRTISVPIYHAGQHGYYVTNGQLFFGTYFDSNADTSPSDEVIVVPIPLPVGAVLDAVRVVVKDNVVPFPVSGTVSTLSSSCWFARNGDNVGTPTESSGSIPGSFGETSDGSGNIQILEHPALNLSFTANTSAYVVVSKTSGTRIAILYQVFADYYMP